MNMPVVSNMHSIAVSFIFIYLLTHLTQHYIFSICLQVIALVMDIFTDLDLFCDLLEASLKRKVPVYILLDEKNLSCFIDMCNTLDIQHSHLNVSQDIMSGLDS